MLSAESDRASFRTLAEAGEHGFGDVPLRADNEPLVSSLLDLAWARATSRERVEPVRRRLQGRKLTSAFSVFLSNGPSTSSLPTSSSSRSLLLLELLSVSLSSMVARGAVTPILMKLASILSTSIVFSVYGGLSPESLLPKLDARLSIRHLWLLRTSVARFTLSALLAQI